jgi:molybdenum cofactor guanylyltransferase
MIGVVLAGGASRRFGSDKAAAVFEGKALIDHAADQVRPYVGTVLVAGRDWPVLLSVADVPEPGLGPLGGLCGALDYAARHDEDAVLSIGCDTLGLSADVVGELDPGPAILESCPVIGLWPASLADVLRDWLRDPANRSVYRFAAHIGARRVAGTVRNVNWPEDLLR